MTARIAGISRDEEETREWGKRLAVYLRPGDVVGLVGELGAGKTRFAQGLARGLGVPADTVITSPTFTLLAIYESGRLPFYHFDFYRLETAVDLERIGAEEYLWGEGVCAVEWAERIPEALPDETLYVNFVIDGDTRRLDFRGAAHRWREVLDTLVAE
ncbi:MAG: tRNA (adenosine(37)-N6)-threonylcarbamoyltransferase complex ATPase subunit type 1 TsaE [Candidatus Lernaella stagnicola]|nr:tRNA (adenosine(37)-N6)-threonylcarbamoyltransferase complex ATPase subunit type 1 TsaE [Candidatus Lernaella stagnicola]